MQLRNTMLTKIIYTCATLMILLSAPLTFGAEVADKSISIPAPEGYIEVTSEMNLAWSLVQAWQGANRIIAFYIPSSERKAALTNKQVNFDRNINIQVNLKAEGFTFTQTDFDLLKKSVRDMLATTQANEIQEKALVQYSGDLSKVAGYDLNMKQTANLSLPMHLDSTNQFSYSEVSSAEVNAPDGKRITDQSTTTSTAILVKGKVLYCYVTGAAGDLNWSRETAKKWVESILNANTEN